MDWGDNDNLLRSVSVPSMLAVVLVPPYMSVSPCDLGGLRCGWVVSRIQGRSGINFL